MLPVANGDAVSVFVEEWTPGTIAGVAAVPFDPPITFPIDLATPAIATGFADLRARGGPASPRRRRLADAPPARTPSCRPIESQRVWVGARNRTFSSGRGRRSVAGVNLDRGGTR